MGQAKGKGQAKDMGQAKGTTQAKDMGQAKGKGQAKDMGQAKDKGQAKDMGQVKASDHHNIRPKLLNQLQQKCRMHLASRQRHIIVCPAEYTLTKYQQEMPINIY